MESYRCDDWNRLSGVKVEIRRHGQLVRAGVVDAVMPDSTVLWLAADYNGNRALFESAEGYEVWANTHDLPDELCSSSLRLQPPTMLITDAGDNLERPKKLPRSLSTEGGRRGLGNDGTDGCRCLLIQ
jgi:hypothetical protein